jgi:hypothetical protein
MVPVAAVVMVVGVEPLGVEEDVVLVVGVVLVLVLLVHTDMVVVAVMAALELVPGVAGAMVEVVLVLFLVLAQLGEKVQSSLNGKSK